MAVCGMHGRDIPFRCRGAARTPEPEGPPVRRNITPPYTVRMVVLTGILQWKYELQLPIPQ